MIGSRGEMRRYVNDVIDHLYVLILTIELILHGCLGCIYRAYLRY
jgi:hypothetical protein